MPFCNAAKVNEAPTATSLMANGCGVGVNVLVGVAVLVGVNVLVGVKVLVGTRVAVRVFVAERTVAVGRETARSPSVTGTRLVISPETIERISEALRLPLMLTVQLAPGASDAPQLWLIPNWLPLMAIESISTAAVELFVMTTVCVSPTREKSTAVRESVRA